MKSNYGSFNIDSRDLHLACCRHARCDGCDNSDADLLSCYMWLRYQTSEPGDVPRWVWFLLVARLLIG